MQEAHAAVRQDGRLVGAPPMKLRVGGTSKPLAIKRYLEAFLGLEDRNFLGSYSDL